MPASVQGKANLEMLSEKEYGFAGDNFFLYLRDLRILSTLDEKEIKLIYQQIENEPDRKQELLNKVVEANLRLVIFFAKKYINRGLEFQDLVQFGNIGLVIAASKYDHRKGNRFSTLAAAWIVHEIERSISLYARPVRLPENILLEQLQISKAEVSLGKELGRNPEDNELAEKLGISVERLQKMKMLKESSLSLDAALVDEGDLTLGDTIAGNANVAEQVIKGINADIIRDILEVLPEKERYILESRYGEKNSTLKEISEEFHVSSEAVRQKEKRAMKIFERVMRTRKLTVEDLLS